MTWKRLPPAVRLPRHRRRDTLCRAPGPFLRDRMHPGQLAPELPRRAGRPEGRCHRIESGLLACQVLCTNAGAAHQLNLQRHSESMSAKVHRRCPSDQPCKTRTTYWEQPKLCNQDSGPSQACGSSTTEVVPVFRRKDAMATEREISNSQLPDSIRVRYRLISQVVPGGRGAHIIVRGCHRWLA